MPSQRPSEQNVVAIIQARMGSTRFPGKVLADLQGRPVLDWVVEAVKRVDGVDEIVVATTTNSEDQVIEEWCLSEGINCFRGEPLDVLKRYADCATKYRATHVVRITADCPLLHPPTVSEVLLRGIESGADYFGLAGEFPDGWDCEGFSLNALMIANKQASEPADREHVTNYFKRFPDTFRTLSVEAVEMLGSTRLTVDHPQDLRFLRELASGIEASAGFWDLRSLSDALNHLPERLRPNSGIRRNEGTPTEV